jgi:hypothetical protein
MFIHLSVTFFTFKLFFSFCSSFLPVFLLFLPYSPGFKTCCNAVRSQHKQVTTAKWLSVFVSFKRKGTCLETVPAVGVRMRALGVLPGSQVSYGYRKGTCYALPQ